MRLRKPITSVPDWHFNQARIDYHRMTSSDLIYVWFNFSHVCVCVIVCVCMWVCVEKIQNVCKCFGMGVELHLQLNQLGDVAS